MKNRRRESRFARDHDDYWDGRRKRLLKRAAPWIVLLVLALIALPFTL